MRAGSFFRECLRKMSEHITVSMCCRPQSSAQVTPVASSEGRSAGNEVNRAHDLLRNGENKINTDWDLY